MPQGRGSRNNSKREQKVKYDICHTSRQQKSTNKKEERSGVGGGTCVRVRIREGKVEAEQATKKETKGTRRFDWSQCLYVYVTCTFLLGFLFLSFPLITSLYAPCITKTERFGRPSVCLSVCVQGSSSSSSSTNSSVCVCL